MKYNEIERLQQLAGIITEIKVNKPPIFAKGKLYSYYNPGNGWEYENIQFVREDDKRYYFLDLDREDEEGNNPEIFIIKTLGKEFIKSK